MRDRVPVPLGECLRDVALQLVWLDGWDSGRAVGDLEGYQRGHIEGHARGQAHGRAQALAEDEEARRSGQRAMDQALARYLTSRPPFAVLAERRGQPERAARQRAILQERGVAR